MSKTWYLPYRGLPFEIIIEIIGKLINDYRALYYVGFCNKFMYDLSVRLLYRKMHSFLGTQSVDYKTDARTKRIAIRAMRSLLNNLHLGVYVHEYTIEDPPPQLGQSAVPIEGLRRGLYAMINLKHLTIETFNARERWKLLFDLDHPRYGLTLNSDHSIDWSASLNVPFHLDTFTCRGYEAHTHCTISQADLNSFLKTQPKLRKIDIQLDEAGWERRISQKTGGVNRTPLQILPSALTCCPELEWVVGDRAAIEALLPGRKVRVVQWKHCRNDSGGSIHHLAKELALVEVLALPDSGIRGIDPPVVQMALYMQDLKYLEVSNKDINSLKWTFNRLPSLIGIVILNSDNRNRHPPMEVAARSKKVADVFDHIPKLQFLAVELSTRYLLRKNFERWQRITDTESPCAGNIPNHPDYVTRSFIRRAIYPSFN